MAGMEPQRWRAAIVWIGLFDRLVRDGGSLSAPAAEPVEAMTWGGGGGRNCMAWKRSWEVVPSFVEREVVVPA